VPEMLGMVSGTGAVCLLFAFLNGGMTPCTEQGHTLSPGETEDQLRRARAHAVADRRFGARRGGDRRVRPGASGHRLRRRPAASPLGRRGHVNGPRSRLEA
jgi:hypothetical protein